MRTRKLLPPALLAVAAAALVAGCGVDTPNVSVPTFPTPSGPNGGDTATFVIGGQTISVTQSGTAQVSTGAKQLDHDGPLGCKGRYFTGHLTEHIKILFSYTKRGAYMLIGNGELYHFDQKPKHSHGSLVFDHDFGNRDIKVIVTCGR